MTHANLYLKLNKLPRSLQLEVADFVDFLLNKTDKKKSPKKRKAGFLKGKIKMMPGFDAPLNDFKEYM